MSRGERSVGPAAQGVSAARHCREVGFGCAGGLAGRPGADDAVEGREGPTGLPWLPVRLLACVPDMLIGKEEKVGSSVF